MIAVEEILFTITGTKYYYGAKPLQIGSVVCCIKEKDNECDQDAIRVVLPIIGKIGYIANSPNTVIHGTMSAGRIYEKVKKKFCARVLFLVRDIAICKVETEDPEVLFSEANRQILEMFDEDEDDM